MRMKCAFAVSLLFSSACQAAPSERAFAQDMLARIKSEALDGEFRIKAGEPLVIQILASEDWDEAYINLHRAYAFCQTATVDDCESVKQEFAAKTSSSTPDPTRSSLRVIVRDQVYLNYIFETFPDRKELPKYRKIGEDLFAFLAADSPEKIALVNQDVLDDLELDAATAWQLAMDQTKAVLPDIPVAKLRAGEPVAFQDFEYLGSLLADTERWKVIAQQSPANMMITVASDQFVFIIFMDEGAELNTFKATVKDDCDHQQRCISPHVYSFQNGAWAIVR